jgi:hypothetical protein
VNVRKLMGYALITWIQDKTFNRIKELEAQEQYFEKKHRARESEYRSQLNNRQSQISETEKKIYNQKRDFEFTEIKLQEREKELKESIALLDKKHQKQVQEKIEIKVPEFVKSAISLLEKKEVGFAQKAQEWNIYGSIALGCAIITAISAVIYGGFEFNSAAKENIEWFFFSFLLLKGLIVVTLFCAFAKHAYNIGNAYMHESLKRSDRMHAINFGKLYLEVYGNDVSQNDMKSIFENWNLNSDSAFVKIQGPNFDPKVIDQATQMINAVSNATSKSGTPPLSPPIK